MSSILIVDDEKDIRELIADILKDEGYQVRLAGNSTTACRDQQRTTRADDPRHLVEGQPDGRHRHPENGQARQPRRPGRHHLGHGNIEIAVAAIKQGAYDFIEKPFNIDQLMVVVSRAMETSRLRRENSELRRKDVTSAEMLGASPAFKALKSQLEKVTKSNGRRDADGAGRIGQGNGRPLHPFQFQPRWRPFISVSSATIEPERMEEVLFGRETSERGVEKGLLEQAHGGVVYFDEVADMPIGTQSKILRVLVEQQFTRAGAPTRSAWTCASSPPPPATCGRKLPRAASGRNFTTG